MRKILLTLTIPLLFNAAAAFASQENISASVKLDKNRITIGDPVNYTVTLQSPLDLKLTVPDRPSQLGLWEVKDFKVFQDKKDRLSSILNYTLVTFTTGTVTIPDIDYQFVDVKNSQFAVKIPSATVTVESVLGLAKGPAALRDIKPPLSLKIPVGIYLFWFIIIAAILLGAWLWYQRYRKSLPQLPQGPVEPAVPPYQTAKEELEKLKNSELLKEGRIKEFYIALSDIIRKFLGAVYSIDTLDKTTSEIYQELRAHEQDKKTLVFIKEFFEECDFVKFAKFRPDEKTTREDFEKALKIVEN